MTRPLPHLPPLAPGLASVVLGAIALMLFVLPILAVPISLCGLALGIAGTVAAIAARSPDLRLCLAGTAVCSLALAIDAGIAYAPTGFLGPHHAPFRDAPQWSRPYLPPPAPFRGAAMSPMRYGHERQR